MVKTWMSPSAGVAGIPSMLITKGFVVESKERGTEPLF